MSHIQVLKIASLLQLSPQTVGDIRPSRGYFQDESISAVSTVFTCAHGNTSSRPAVRFSRVLSGHLSVRWPWQLQRWTSDWKFGFWTTFSLSTHSGSPLQWSFSSFLLSCTLLFMNTWHLLAYLRLDISNCHPFPLLPVFFVSSLPSIC